MAGAYRSWQDGGAVFQYLSSSPWQLYPALAKFIESADFPRGSFHLRYLRVADLTILDLLDPPQKTKPPVIKDLLEAYPGRQFFLVGDTGECDPEIYGAIARTHSGRIGHIYIRDVAARKVPDCAGVVEADQRMERAFAGLPADLVTVFADASELPKSIGAD